VQDKYVRRRRTVLGIFIVAILVAVTAVFGEAENSPLHPVQQGLIRVTKPIGKGVSEVVSPVGSLGHWVSTTLHAKSRNTVLRRNNARLDRELAARGIAVAENAELKGMLALTTRLNLGQDAPVYADVDRYNPEQYYETVGIDKGTDDGIRQGDPVIGQYGLVGDVTHVTPTSATVSGLSSPKFGVFTEIVDRSGKGGYGTLEPVVGHPLTLQLNYVAASSLINPGDEVVTATYAQGRNRAIPDPYPANIPVGVISSANYNQLENDGTVNMTPSVNMHNLMDVEVLTGVKGN
jgi:rod shape-determining protein MreC